MNSHVLTSHDVRVLAMCDVSKYKVEKISPEEVKQGKKKREKKMEN